MFARPFFASLAAAVLVATAHADELTKTVQNSLKEQGFYYGEVTGVNSPETAAAIKRYQIRNGLEVTGTLNQQTLAALGMGDDVRASQVPPAPTPAPAPKKARSTPAPPPPAVERSSRPPTNLRRDDSAAKSDREYLQRQQPAAPQPEYDSRPQSPPALSGGSAYAQLFARTPYASAPLEVQQNTIRQAQRFLQKLDFYKQEIDGFPGPDLEEGILSYQRFINLPLTGQLDIETLAAMRLLPGRGGAPTRTERPAVRTVPGKPLRGVWIQ